MTNSIGVIFLFSLGLGGLAVRAEGPSAVDKSGHPILGGIRAQPAVASVQPTLAEPAPNAAPALASGQQAAPAAPIIQLAPVVQGATVMQAAPASLPALVATVQAGPGIRNVQTLPVVQATAVAPVAGATPVIQAPVAPVAQTASGMQSVAPETATSPVAVVAVSASATQRSPVIGNEVALPMDSWRPLHTIWSEFSALERCIAGLSFASMIKAVCMLGNMLVQVSPFPQVRRWELRQDTGESDAAPYVSIAFGGWQWCYYGLFAFFLTKRSGFLVLVHSNCLGAVLGTYYAITFYRNCNHKGSRQGFQRYLSCVSTLVLIQICALGVLPIDRALFMTGLISSFCGFVGAISMLVSLPTVIRTQDSRTIPGPLVLANNFSSLAWWVCGWMLSDPMISAPNIVCFFCSGICLYLKYRYPSDESADCEEAAAEPEAGKMIHISKAKQLQFDTPSLKEMSFKEESFKQIEESTPLRATPVDCCGTGGTF